MSDQSKEVRIYITEQPIPFLDRDVLITDAANRTLNLPPAHHALGFLLQPWEPPEGDSTLWRLALSDCVSSAAVPSQAPRLEPGSQMAVCVIKTPAQLDSIGEQRQLEPVRIRQLLIISQAGYDYIASAHREVEAEYHAQVTFIQDDYRMRFEALNAELEARRAELRAQEQQALEELRSTYVDLERMILDEMDTSMD